MSTISLNHRKSCCAFFKTNFHIASAFNSSTKEIAIESHILHGFKNSSSYWKSCNNYRGIWFGQELWPQERQLRQLCELRVQYVVLSWIETVSIGILHGWLFGGVSITWTKDFHKTDKPILNFCYKSSRNKQWFSFSLSLHVKPNNF